MRASSWTRLITLLTFVGLLVGCRCAAGEEDDSVRCRLSGICEGARQHCRSDTQLPQRPGPTGDDLAAARDAVLACTVEAADRAQRVKEAAKWTWKGYRDCAWAKDELRPLSCSSQHWLNLSLTAVDGLDSLFMLGLLDEFEQAAELVTTSFAPQNAGDCNVFETTIRALGGLLATHRLARGSHPQQAQRMLEQAADLGARLANTFNSSSGIAHSDVNLTTGATSGSVSHSSTSEIATLSLEFTLLARLTGRPEFEERALKVHDVLSGAVAKGRGLLPQHFATADGAGRGDYIMLGARTDSYYEYLLKQWIMTGKEDERLLQRFVEAMQAVRASLVRHTAGNGAASCAADPSATNGDDSGSGGGDNGSNGALSNSDPAGAGACGSSEEVSGGGASRRAESGLLYVGELFKGKASPKMDHLVCFLPGALALADFHGVSTARPTTCDPSDLQLAEDLAHTCYQLYRRTPTGLAPEIAHFTNRTGDPDFPGSHAADIGGGDFHIKDADAHNLLRPEAVESLFLLWKVTGDPSYREQAWAIFRAFERWTRVEGMVQCLGADPAAAAGQVAKGASIAAVGAAAAAAAGGQPAAEALQAGSAAADCAIKGMALTYSHVQQEYLDAIVAMATAAADAAAAATVQELMAAGPGRQGAAQHPGADNATISSEIEAAVQQLARGGCLPSSRGGGYSGLRSVKELPPPRMDKMESFWLAETLKYLYLIFTEPPDRCLHPSCQPAHPPASGADSGRQADEEGRRSRAKFPLDRFVFNTEAHPLPIVGPADASFVGAEELSPLVLQPYAEGGGAYAPPPAKVDAAEGEDAAQEAAADAATACEGEGACRAERGGAEEDQSAEAESAEMQVEKEVPAEVAADVQAEEELDVESGGEPSAWQAVAGGTPPTLAHAEL